jgi:hypothetical protein
MLVIMVGLRGGKGKEATEGITGNGRLCHVTSPLANENVLKKQISVHC